MCIIVWGGGQIIQLYTYYNTTLLPTGQCLARNAEKHFNAQTLLCNINVLKINF